MYSSCISALVLTLFLIEPYTGLVGVREGGTEVAVDGKGTHNALYFSLH